MDKYELVLDIIGHPEKYTAERLAEIMSDPETREIYNLLCKADSAVEANRETDVDAEWENFARRHGDRLSSGLGSDGRQPRPLLLRWFGSRAASIAAIVCTSIVAVAAGIAVTVTLTDRSDESRQVAAATPERSESEYTDSISTVPADTVSALTAPVMFEDEPLEAIMNTVARAYGVEVRFNNDEAASLHLYYKLDPSLPLDEVVSQLNTFEQINIRRNGNTLTIY